MRPLTFLNGVIFGSATALGGGSAVILLLRFVLGRDASLNQTVVQSALPIGELGRDAALFSAVAVLAGLAFWGQVATRRWRWMAELVLAVALSAAAVWFLAVPGDRARDLITLALAAIAVFTLGVAGWRTGFFRRIFAWLEKE